MILLHSTLDSRKILSSNVLPNSRSKSSLERYLPNSELSNPLSHILLRVFALGTPTCLAFAWHAVGHVAPVKNLQHTKMMTNLVVKYSSSSELSNPTVVNTNCCISPENHPPKFLGSRANCCICCSCFHSVYFDTLGSTSPVVEHLAQVKSLRHI